MTAPELSFVIPCHNEQDNLLVLLAEIRAAVAPLNRSYEIIITDDGSQDQSWAVLKEAAAADPRVRAQRFAGNYGQSAAQWAGMKIARGQYLVTLDADLQNDPQDLPKFLAGLKDYDCVCGSRIHSRHQGDGPLRIASARIANWVRNRVSHEQISDSGCCFRAFKRECIQNLKLFNGIHRFLPTLFKLEGFTVTEIAITTRPRLAGRSHYNVWNRLFASTYDLLAVRWMQQRMLPYPIAERIN